MITLYWSYSSSGGGEIQTHLRSSWPQEARTVERGAVMDESGRVHVVGDGRLNPTSLEFGVSLNAGTFEDSLDALVKLVDAARRTRRIRYGHRIVSVFGLERVVKRYHATRVEVTLVFARDGKPAVMLPYETVITGPIVAPTKNTFGRGAFGSGTYG